MMEISKERIVELFTAEGEGIKNMVIAVYISAENNETRAQREHNIDMLSQIREALEEVPGTERYRKICGEGIELLEKELRELADE